MGVSAVVLSILLLAAALLIISTTIILSLIPTFITDRSASLQTNTKALRIAIIGGGISGLNAGLTLSDSNLFSNDKIVIYEANTNIGGRMHSRRWPSTGQTSEWCGEFLDSNYDSMLSLVKRFNIVLLDTIAETNALYHNTFYFLNRFYNQAQAWIDYKVVEDTIKSQIAQIGVIDYTQSNAYGRSFDNLSLYDWIEKYIPNGHRSNFGQYIDSAYTQENGLDTTELSSLMFLKSIAPASQPPNGPLSIYGLSDQRYRMRGGNDQLPTKIGQYLTERGIKTQLDHNLTKIVRLSNTKYRLTFSNNRAYTFDHVILTLPTTTLKYVDYSQAEFDTLKKRVISESRYGTNTKLNLQFTRRFWYDLSADGVIYTDLPFLNSWEESLGQSESSGILVFLTGGKEALTFDPRAGFDAISNASGSVSTNVYIENILKDLNKVWPDSSKFYSGEGAVSAPWNDKHFLGSYPANTLNQYSTLSGAGRLRQGNVHFSGDYTSVDYIGLMEGAVPEGERAAKEIIGDYKRLK